LLTTAYNQQTTTVQEALAFFRRSAFAGEYASLTNTSKDDSDRYWEANILGNPRLPEGVKFLVANFGTLFGTVTGKRLQQLADHFSWPLVWALGDAAATKSGGGGHKQKSGPFAGNQRVLDPVVATTVNITKSVGATDSFNNLWDVVATKRQDGTPTPQQWGAWWDELAASQERVAPITSQACSASANCLGTSIETGDCICKTIVGALV